MPPLWFMVLFFGGIAAVITIAVFKSRRAETERQQWQQFEDEIRREYGQKN